MIPMNNEIKKTKKLNNKGFSLVELIIVIAIMAVLVGVLAPQYLKYVDKSKKGVDEQMCDSLRAAIETTYLDPNVKHGAVETTTKKALGADATGESFWTEVYGIMGVSDAAGVKALLKLDPSTAAVAVTYTLDSNGKVTVYVDGGKYTGNLAIKCE